MAEGAVRLHGMREFTRELMRGSRQLRREIGRTHKTIGDRVIVPAAQQRMAQEGKGRGGTLGARGIKASASTTSLKVLLSGANPRTLGDEFGAVRWHQFRSWKGNQWTGLDPGSAGYAVQPVIRERHTVILEAYLEGYEGVLHRAYPNAG